MAEKDLKVVIGTEDRYSAEFSRFQGKLGGINASTIQSAAMFGALGLSIGGVVGFFKQAIEAANEQEAAEKKLSVALGYTSQSLLAQADALQQTTTFGDDQIINAQALIASFTKNEEHTRLLTKATLDLASAKDMDLSSAAELVAKTLATETNALARQGIQVHGAANSTERLTSLTEGIARLYGGQAAAAADTFGGKMKQLGNAISELSEAVGGHITKSSLFKDILEAEIQGLYDLAAIVGDIGKFDAAANLKHYKDQLSGLEKELAIAEGRAKNFWGGYSVASQMVIDDLKDQIVFVKLAIANATFEMDEAAAKAKGIKPTTAAAPESEDARKKIEALELATKKLGATKEELAVIELEEFKRLTTNTKQLKEFTAALEENIAKEEKLHTQKVKQKAIDELAKGEGFKERKFDNTILSPDEMSAERMRISAYYDAKIKMLQQAGDRKAEIEKAQHDKSVEMERLTWNQRYAIASTMSTAMVGVTDALQVLLGKKNRTLFEIGKAIAIADAQMKGYQVIMAAWRDGSEIHTVVGVIMAAAAAVKVAAQIKQIQDTKFGDTKTPSFVGGGGGASTPSRGQETPIREGEAPVAAQQITVIINNPLNGTIAADVADAIVAAVNGAAERNVHVTVRAA